MNSELFKAILALDSYNRGYNAGISSVGTGLGTGSENIGAQIGNAVISKNSSAFGTIAGTGIRQDANANFYAVAYSYAGRTVISYRGTDNIGPDMANGWITGAGIVGQQAQYAARFYNAVIGTDNPLTRNDVEFTGHSLGGGLAGLMSTLYGKNATLFDNMPFELAASLVPSVSQQDIGIRNIYYFNGANSLYTTPNLNLLTAYATTGEVLGAIRGGQSTPVHYFDSNGGLRSPVDLHSQALLVNLMYAEQAGLTDWNNIGADFIDSLFDANIANAAGFGSVAGVYPIAQKMLAAIAYSAIDEGTRIFGDTAIRAMFDDANEFGKALDKSYTSSFLRDSKNSITNILVQFAAKLAIDKVLQSSSPTAVNGVLELSGDGEQLDINFGNSLWGSTSSIVGRSDLINNLLSGSSLSSDNIRSSMQSMWGNSADNIFDHVVLAAKDTDITANILTPPSSTAKANLFVGGKGNDIIVGSSGNDLLIGGKGTNAISGGGGNDIIIGGEGKDTLAGGAGNDAFMFGASDGVDTITDAEDGDKIIFASSVFNGLATTVGKNVYEISNNILSKAGNDLLVAFDGGKTGVTIKNFFKATYDPKADYTFMGITIPKLMDADGDGIDDSLKNMKTVDASIASDGNKFTDAVKSAESRMDPLVVDLNGNGIALDSWQTSNALFDLNGDGTKENTGWTKANGDDAFLVIDKNGDGKINDISEMFGNADISGFAQLKAYDSNGDGVINASDSQFNLLKLWNDKNANGTVEAGELTTLAQNSITGISTRSYGNSSNINGNLQTASSEVTLANGTTRTINELYFGFDSGAPGISNNRDATLPASFQLNIESILMPYSRGYGSLYSWQAAMTLDATLLAMAKDIAATEAVN